MATTALPAPVLVENPPDQAPDRPPWRIARWLPALLVSVFSVAVVTWYGVPIRQTAAFAAYVTLGIALPGTLCWRALRGGSRCFVEEVAAGTALGYAAEVLTYIPARAVGAPLLVLVWPIGTIAAFAAVRALRRHWKGPGRAGQAPIWWAWTIAALVAFTVALSAVTFFRTHGLVWPGNASPYVDIPWHLSMAADVKHHMPAAFPYVLGEPLLYHWFVYADFAATSWVSGIELQTLLLRLWMLPVLAAYTVLIAVAARRITGRWWAGPVAVAINYFVVAPRPDAGSAVTVPFGAGPTGLTWLSPTQSFGSLLFVPLVLILVDILRRPDTAARRWVLAGVLLAAVMGAKATFVPLLLAGLLLVLAVRALAYRRLHRSAALAAGITALALVFSQLVLYRGEDQGLRVAPFHVMHALERGAEHDRLLLLVIYVFCWACAIAGVFGLARRPRGLLDPAVSLLSGVGAAGMAAALFFGHPGIGELYFLRSASPYLAILAAYGMVSALPHRTGRWTAAALLGAACAGAGVAALIRAARPALPYLMLAGALALVCGLLARAGWRRGWALALVVAAAMGTGLPPLRDRLIGPFESAARGGWRSATHAKAPAGAHLPPGALKAARWLRDHSAPDDVVATNAHCRFSGRKRCDNRHFWVAAYTERRVLVEGWGYANGVNTRAGLHGGPSMGYVRFGDPALLARNDAAFRTPSARTVGHLRDRYGVRWLFADERYGRSPALSRFAAPRFRAGRCAVYEISYTAQRPDR